MKLFLSIAAAGAAAIAAASAADIPANIQAGIDNPNRTEANRERDESRKPGEVLAFFGVEEGMTVIDMASGGGYFTEIISGAVGPDGKVVAHNTAGQRFDEQREALEAQYAPFGNIEIAAIERGDPLPYEDNSADIILLSLIIHHLHYEEEGGEVMPDRATQIYNDFKRVLKPGGVFAVIEHTAAPGSTREESAAWHRAPEDIIKADVTSVGFTFDGGADIHVNPDDDLKNVWFETGLQGKTTRMVHRYISPE